MALERVLTKLRFDEAVSGYALITNDGQPFLTFSLPDDIVPIIQGTMEIHSSSLKLMNVMSSEGIVILARVDQNWVLAVLFSIDASLGMALQRTRDVVSHLEGVDLPPPPKKTVPSVVTPSLPESQTTTVTVTPEAAPVPEKLEDIPLDDISISHGCVVNKGKMFNDASSIQSALYQEMVSTFSNVGVDVLLMVDENRTVFKIAETLARRVEHMLEIVKWCVSKHIVIVECPDEQTPGKREIVEMPLFEGKIGKAKKEHRSILELCDGTRTTQDIAQELNIPYFQALQAMIPYRGKTLKFIRRDIEIR